MTQAPAREPVGRPAALAAGFLAPPEMNEQVQAMYDGDRDGQGYVAELTKVWAYSPGALAALSHAMAVAVDMGELDMPTRSLLVTAAASAINDSYCSLAWGSKLVRYAGAEATASIVAGDDSVLAEEGRALAAWARKVARDPSALEAADVDELRAVGLDDRKVFAVTLFVALRVAFSMVNDALGASPDAELVARAPRALLDAVDFGRPPLGG